MADTRIPETNPTPTGDKPDKPLWAQTTFVLSVILVVAIVAAGAWLVASGPSSPRARPAPQTSRVQPLARGCGPAADPADLPPAAAPPTTWRLVGHMAAPSSPAAGPADSTDGIPVCYAPDAVGALFTAANFIAATSANDAPAKLRRAALTTLTVDDAARTLAVANYDGTGGGPSSFGMTIAGFSFTSYDPAHATTTVDLALLVKGSYLHLPVQLRWTSGDWRVQLPVSGNLFAAFQPVPDPTGALPGGYIPWQGA